MIRANGSLAEAKAAIRALLGKPVAVKINLGRNKTASYTGTLNGFYPALFTVLPDDPLFTGKTSYSYSEYVCKHVKLKELPSSPPKPAP